MGAELGQTPQHTYMLSFPLGYPCGAGGSLIGILDSLFSFVNMW